MVYANVFNGLENLLSNQVGASSPINSFGNIYGILLNVMIGIGIGLATIFIAFSGILFMTAREDPKKLEQARKSFVYSLAALFISLASVALKIAIVNLIGVTDPNVSNNLPSF